MKILKPVSREALGGYSREDYSPVAMKLATLPEGMALPVECADQRKAQALCIWVYQCANKQSMYDTKWSACRRKNTVYITRAPHANGTGGPFAPYTLANVSRMIAKK